MKLGLLNITMLKFERSCCSVWRVIDKISVFNFVSLFSMHEIRIRFWCFILCYSEFIGTFFQFWCEVRHIYSHADRHVSHSHECNRKINFHVLSSTAFLTLHRVDRMQSFTRPSCEVPHSSSWYMLAFLPTVTRWTCTIRDVITHSCVAAIPSRFLSVSPLWLEVWCKTHKRPIKTFKLYR